MIASTGDEFDSLTPQPLEPRTLMAFGDSLAEALDSSAPVLDDHTRAGAIVVDAGETTAAPSAADEGTAYSSRPHQPGDEQVPPGGTPDVPAPPTPPVPAGDLVDDTRDPQQPGERPPASDIQPDTGGSGGGGTFIDDDGSGPIVDDQGVRSVSVPSGMRVIAVNTNGVPIAFRLVGDAWHSRVLTGLSGTLSADGDLAVFVDPKDGQTYAITLSRGALTLYRELADGTFGEARTLNDTTAEGNSVVSGLTVFVSADNRMHVVGLNDVGELLMFYQSGLRLAEGGARWDWVFENINVTQLAPQGQATPDWTGNLTVYITPWNGMNIAGLSTDGDLEVVWWSPGRRYWSTVNLSENTGLGTLVGGLTSYVAPWGGLNIAGIDESGDLQVVWWLPGDGAQWRSTNMTEEFDGQKLDPTTVMSFVTPWGGLNIVGLDAETGDAVAYWWAPDRTDWTADTITFDRENADDPLPTGRLVAANNGNELNLFGRAESGELIRLYWSPGDGSVWSVQNLSEIAT